MKRDTVQVAIGIGRMATELKPKPNARAQRGGQARAAALSPERRSEIAKTASDAARAKRDGDEKGAA